MNEPLRINGEAAPRQRILLVDDDPGVTELLEMALPEYEIDVRRDAESALKAAAGFRPELFILDVVLPGMKGTTLAGRLRDTDAFAATPILLISGRVQGAGGQGGPVRVNGLVAFAKPFSFTTFKQHVRLHLSGRLSSEAAVQLLPSGWIGW